MFVPIVVDAGSTLARVGAALQSFALGLALSIVVTRAVLDAVDRRRGRARGPRTPGP